MADLQVTCIKRLIVDVPNAHAGITHLGGENWLLSRREVIDAINAGTDTFYTLVDGNRAVVRVRSGYLNHPEFVQTEADGQWTNNLLELTSCGSAE